MLKYFFFISIIFNALIGCSQKSAQEKDGIQLVSSQQFNTLTANKDIILLDVRTNNEVKKGFIKGSKNIDIFSDDFENQLKQLDTTKAVLVYCAAGGRSAEAAELLIKLGFKTVYDLDKGIVGWKQDGLPIETP